MLIESGGCPLLESAVSAVRPGPALVMRLSALLVGYARCSTDQQDVTVQRDALLGLVQGLSGVEAVEGVAQFVGEEVGGDVVVASADGAGLVPRHRYVPITSSVRTDLLAIVRHELQRAPIKPGRPWGAAQSRIDFEGALRLPLGRSLPTGGGVIRR